MYRPEGKHDYDPRRRPTRRAAELPSGRTLLVCICRTLRTEI
jgi:hypothetical protein